MINIDILENATAQAALNLFNLKYPESQNAVEDLRLKECINDTTFIINNFMRIVSDLSENIINENN